MPLIAHLVAILIAVAATAAAVEPGAMATYCFSAHGDDAAGDGSATHPWRTIAKANGLTLHAGDRLAFAGGDTFAGTLLISGEGGTAERPIVVTSSGEGRAIIDAGEGDGVRIRNVGGITIERLIVRGGGGAKRGDGIAFANDLPGSNRLASIRVSEVEASECRNGISVGGWPADGSVNGFSDVRIERCVAHGNTYVGITTWGREDPARAAYANEDVAIIDCIAHDNPGDPAFLDNHSGNGILMGNVARGLIERCVAYGNGAQCHCTKGGPVGIWAYASTRVVIQHCESYDNRTGCPFDGGGFDFDGGVSDSVMQYNYSHGNDGAGYLLYAYPGSPYEFARNICRFNLSRDDGRRNNFAGIYVGADGTVVSDLEIYHNTVVVSPSSTGTPAAVVVRNTERVRFRANLLVAAGGVPILSVTGDHPGLVFAGNAYWSPGQPTAFRWDGAAHAGLAAWRAASGQERIGDQPGGCEVDPRFATGRDGRDALRLDADSPLRRAAIDLGLDPGAHDGFAAALGTGPHGIGADAAP
ncbi:MAG: right-handed parallel beta-helix repeat-containing protein [Planctomycetes bacterium]|nr:right-handed parallel beta-helix repeat-containing protein [Planctomycetota bacterium]